MNFQQNIRENTKKNMDFISDKFFDKAFWLPKDCSWEQMYKYTGINLTQYFFQCIALAMVISVVRIVFEKCIGYPIGAFFGVPDKKECKPNPTLEKLYIDQKQTLNSSVAMVCIKKYVIAKKDRPIYVCCFCVL